MTAKYDGGPVEQLERYKVRRAQMVMADGRMVYGWWLRWHRRVTVDVTDEQIRKEAAAAAKLHEELSQ